jgi:uronate dehydrogenase|tara:strand:+ start:79 stop:888 length:810 start_codon:yes stop_codon:yes gene_type:complete
LSKHKYKNILLTGAAGALGNQLRETLSKECDLLKISDKVNLEKKFHNEKVEIADLASTESILKLTKDIDCIVHMGGQSIEGSWDNVLNSNIIGMYNLYEACRKNKIKRVIWASSVHTVGFYPRSEVIDSKVMPRPDSNYGLSKVFGESLAQYYWDKYKIETVSVRIYSCVPEPKDHRMLSTWLSYDDLRSLIIACINCPNVQHSVIFGVSNNDSVLIDNKYAKHIGYKPKDNAEEFRSLIEKKDGFIDSTDSLVTTHGGYFASSGHFDD